MQFTKLNLLVVRSCCEQHEASQVFIRVCFATEAVGAGKSFLSHSLVSVEGWMLLRTYSEILPRGLKVEACPVTLS